MTALNEEQLKEFWKEITDKLDREAEFLRSQGWEPTDDGLWQSPTGEKFPHNAGLFNADQRQAYTEACCQFLRNNGWKEWAAKSFHLDGTSNYEDSCPGYSQWISPTTGKSWGFLDAVGIVVEGQSEDFPENDGEFSYEIRKILKEQGITPVEGASLEYYFYVEDGNAVWKFKDYKINK